MRKALLIFGSIFVLSVSILNFYMALEIKRMNNFKSDAIEKMVELDKGLGFMFITNAGVSDEGFKKWEEMKRKKELERIFRWKE